MRYPDHTAEFDKLVRMVQRQHNVAEPVPPFFIRTLCGLETSLTTAIVKEKEAKKKMNATNARALTAMKQKVKRAAKEHEKGIKLFSAVSLWNLCTAPSDFPSGPGSVGTGVCISHRSRRANLQTSQERPQEGYGQ